MKGGYCFKEFDECKKDINCCVEPLAHGSVSVLDLTKKEKSKSKRYNFLPLTGKN